MKLFKVTVQHTLVVRAADANAARVEGMHAVRYCDTDADECHASEITSAAQLPDPWDAECRPWGERDPWDRTIGEMLDAKDK